MGYKQNSLNNSFQDILITSPLLKTVLQKADKVTKLNQAVSKNLEPELVPYCRVANIRDGVLILTTPSPIWGHQLRFTSLSLLTTLRKEEQWCGLTSIKIHVRPNDEKLPVILPSLPIPALSLKGAAHLKEAAAQIKHLGLQEALERLSQRHDN